MCSQVSSRPFCGVRTTDLSIEHDYPGEPDLLIIHGGPRHVSTLHGFPPWLIRLCEISHDVDAQPDKVLSPLSFEYALRRFLKSEQRHGR